MRFKDCYLDWTTGGASWPPHRWFVLGEEYRVFAKAMHHPDVPDCVEYLSVAESQALLSQAIAERDAAMLALKTECERSAIFRKGLEKLEDGPGTGMAGWKLTWAHKYAGEIVTKGAALTPEALADGCAEGEKP